MRSSYRGHGKCGPDGQFALMVGLVDAAAVTFTLMFMIWLGGPSGVCVRRSHSLRVKMIAVPTAMVSRTQILLANGCLRSPAGVLSLLCLLMRATIARQGADAGGCPSVSPSVRYRIVRGGRSGNILP